MDREARCRKKGEGKEEEGGGREEGGRGGAKGTKLLRRGGKPEF
jgi:hypothetical protein